VRLTVNVGTGVVKTPVYKEGTRPPQLPEFVVVDFGDTYHGESLYLLPEQPGDGITHFTGSLVTIAVHRALQ
jgi:hypothetical protein